MEPRTSRARAARIRRLFDEVVDLTPAVGTARLERERDADLRREVEALLSAYDRADDILHELDHPAADPRDELTGKRVSHYRILGKMGGGGMGVVYRARDERLDRTVALKFLPPDLTRDRTAKQRFIQEAKAASALDHPNICTIHDIGETEEGRLFIVMACYLGETLKKKIARSPLPLSEVLDYAVQITVGLGRAHRHGMVHRDIKPDNVMVTDEGQVKILDFGLAKLEGRTQLTKTGTTLGTVAYMSPEQLRNRTVDSRTDIWALGAVLYEMITGRRPFAGDAVQGVAYSILNEDPEPVTALRTGVPMTLERIVEKLLQRDPARRYQHVEDAAVDLNSVDVRAHRRAEASAPTPGVRRLVIGAALLAAAITGAAVWLVVRSAAWSASSVESAAGGAVQRFVIPLPEHAPVALERSMPGGVWKLALALSPDGTRLVYTESTTAQPGYTSVR